MQPNTSEMQSKPFENIFQGGKIDISEVLPFLKHHFPPVIQNSFSAFCAMVPWATELPARAIIMGNRSQTLGQGELEARAGWWWGCPHSPKERLCQSKDKGQFD